MPPFLVASLSCPVSPATLEPAPSWPVCYTPSLVWSPQLLTLEVGEVNVHPEGRARTAGPITKPRQRGLCPITEETLPCLPPHPVSPGQPTASVLDLGNPTRCGGQTPSTVSVSQEMSQVGARREAAWPGEGSSSASSSCPRVLWPQGKEGCRLVPSAAAAQAAPAAPCNLAICLSVRPPAQDTAGDAPEGRVCPKLLAAAGHIDSSLCRPLQREQRELCLIFRGKNFHWGKGRDLCSRQYQF